MPDLGTTSRWQPWFKTIDFSERLIGNEGERVDSRLFPIKTPAISGQQYFRVLAQNTIGRSHWRLAGDLIVFAGVPTSTNAVQIDRFSLFLNKWTLISVEDTEGEFFISMEACHWHLQMSITIEVFDPQPASSPEPAVTSITVSKNAIINPSFEIWHETANEVFNPAGIQKITLAPGWMIRSWTNQPADFGTIRASREISNEASLPFTTYLRWNQITPKDGGGVLYLANQVNELALSPGDVIVFHGYGRVLATSGFSVNVVLEGGGHPWTNLGRVSLNAVWAPFSLTYQLFNSLPSNLHGLLVQFMMPNNKAFNLDLGGLQLEVNGRPTDLELYLN